MAGKSTIRPSMLSLKLAHNLFINKKGITIKDLAKNINTDYKNVHDSISVLFKEGIIKKEKIGNYNICRLNYSNEDIAEYLKEYNFYIKVKGFRKKYPTEYRIIIESYEQLQKDKHIDPSFICLIFGSYAKNEEKRGSDIDILFLTPGSLFNDKDIVKNTLNKINTIYQKKFHISHQHTRNFVRDLKKMKKLSIATEIYKEPPIVFYGDDIFFRMMIEANKLW